MTDYEATVLEHYQLTTPYPVEWPAEKDLSDASDDDNDSKPPSQKSNARKPRFSVLERVSNSRKSFVPGAQKTGDGVENLVQRDEADPLGSKATVVRMLRDLGLPVSEDTNLRNRFLLSSTTFSPALFLAQVHSSASISDLLMGRDVLSQSIDQKSASLKVLVESEFERFVRATSVIDSVYDEMKTQGVDASQPKARTHSRHTSRNSTNFRGANIPVGTPVLSGPPSPVPGKRKNALLKESEYGVLGIKTPLVDVSAKAEEVWGSALGGREKEEKMKNMVSSLERSKDYYELATLISDSIKRKDYEALVEEYSRAKRFSDESKALAETILSSRTPATDAQIYQILAASRMWHDVEEIVGGFKRDIQKRLVLTQGRSSKESGIDSHLELISILLELGVEENPIWTWLSSRYEGLKSKISTFSEHSKIEIEVMRRRLASTDKPNAHAMRSNLRSLTRHGPQQKTAHIDSPDIIELWEKMVEFLANILSPQGLLGEVVEFWQTTLGFLEGKTQKTLPAGLNGESRKHHTLSKEGMLDLQNGTVELVDMIRESVYCFFADPPMDDISALFSPTSTAPASPYSTSVTPSLTPTALRPHRFTFDAGNMPPPSPRRGEAWEKFAFWPPWSNSLSAVHYLSKLLVLVASGATDMAAIRPVMQDVTVFERLKGLVGSARERSVTAISAAWSKDAENMKFLEDWKRPHDRKDLTTMPVMFEAFEVTLLAGMQKVLYVSEAKLQPGCAEVVTPPPAKLLQIVQNQFVTTVYKALSGMVENAEKFVVPAEDDWSSELSGLASPTMNTGAATSQGTGPGNISDRDVRMLLTLSNLQHVRLNTVPTLTSYFENAFSIKLTNEIKTIRDVLGKIDARLFSAYTTPAVEILHRIIQAGISSPDWVPGLNERPRAVSAYVYEALLSLVLVHTQVSTNAASLLPQTMSYLLEQTSRELLAAFSARAKYTLAALMQATLDIEFVAQTLGQYNTDRASEIQSQVYQALDKGTDNDARQKLQAELPQMRTVLKTLREASKTEFACFKKMKRPAAENPPPV